MCYVSIVGANSEHCGAVLVVVWWMRMEPKLPRASVVDKELLPPRPKNRPIVQEVIDLEVEADDRLPSTSSSEQFMSGLARKCSSFFGWISNPSSDGLAEQLWKQKMLATGAARFPELSQLELERLVERDWQLMGTETRSAIVEQYSRCPEGDQVERNIREMSLPGPN